MTRTFNIEFQWLPRENGNAVERATLAELAIHIDHFCATELEDQFARTIRRSARLSAFHIASWLVTNWWRLRWEPESNTQSWRMSHKVGGAGGGYMWPDLTLTGDGSTILFRGRPTSGSDSQSIRYLSNFDVVISAHEFEIVIDEFVEAVLARLSGEHCEDNNLQMLWREVCEERRTPAYTSWRKLEAMMGFDPDDAPEELVQQLLAKADSFGQNAIAEIAAASKADVLRDLKELVEDARPQSVTLQVPHVDRLRERIKDDVEAVAFPWQKAETAAMIARDVWSITEGPITTESLSNIFEITRAFLQDSENIYDGPISSGFRGDNRTEEIRIVLNKRHPTSRRFGLARLVADHLDAALEDRFLPATDVKTDRQKFQRAFAQEFLCPFQHLDAFLGDGPHNDDVIEDAAFHFDVSPLLVKTTLVNKGMMDRDLLPA